MLKKTIGEQICQFIIFPSQKKAKLLCEAFFPSPNKIRGMKTKKLGKIQF
jgi:hypothetical protein